MAGQAKRYRVEVWDRDEFLGAFLALPESQQVRVSELMNDHLPYRPKEMRPPLLKQLKGSYGHLRQFECGQSRRLLYEIDDTSMTVRIVYLGEHPEWDKPGKVRA